MRRPHADVPRADHLGPGERLAFDFADRINVITGDNGLGKSFILNGAWWALTRQWPGCRRGPSRSTPFIVREVRRQAGAHPTSRGTIAAGEEHWEV